MSKLFILLQVALLVGCGLKSENQILSLIEKPLEGDKEVVCFLYHRFGDNRYPSTNISLKDFEAHLAYLKTNNFQVLTFSDAIDYMRSDTDSRKTAVITIDDGFKSFFKNALPLLKKYDFPATLFLNTETVEGNDYMNWKEVMDAHNHKIEIGNHTHSHDYFLNLPEETRYISFEEDIRTAQNIIKEHLGIKPVTFAYPYGELDPKMRAIVKKLEFKAGAAQNSGVISAATDVMQCPRFPMAESYSALDKFTSKAKMSALPIIKVTPESFMIPAGQSKPELKMTFKSNNLRLDQLQCFIQGSECNNNLITQNDSLSTVTVVATMPINKRRRTLYTLTVPDKDGNWHWFSHLWINPNKPG